MTIPLTGINGYMYWTRSMWQTPPKNPQLTEQVIHAALGVAGEAGEVVDLVKKFMFVPDRLTQKGQSFLNEMELEIGDVIYYLARLVDELGLDFTQIMERNRAKLEQRYGA